MSAPHVAGVAALVLAAGVLNDVDGDYGVANELRRRLAETAVDLGTPGRDPQYGYGLVDAMAASGVVEPPATDITLNARAYTVGRVGYVDLVWSGADGSAVYVYRNGVFLTTTPNDGFHTDRIGPVSGGTYGYNICETATSVCSLEVQVSF